MWFHNSKCLVADTRSQLRIEKKAGDAALISMTQNVQSRLDVKQRKRACFIDGIPVLSS